MKISLVDSFQPARFPGFKPRQEAPVVVLVVLAALAALAGRAGNRIEGRSMRHEIAARKVSQGEDARTPAGYV